MQQARVAGSEGGPAGVRLSGENSRWMAEEWAQCLRDACDAEDAGAFLESLRLCRRVLAANPADVGALGLMGRLCARSGDLAGAVGLQLLALRVDPSCVRAQHDLAQARALVPDTAAARVAYEAACRLEPAIAVHHCVPGSQLPLASGEEVRALLERAVAADPTLAAAQAGLANLLAREERYADALAAYRRALLLDMDDAALYLAVAELLHDFGAFDEAERHRSEAFARRRVYLAGSTPQPAVRRVLVLCAPGPWSVNAPLDFVLDARRNALHRCYLAERRAPPLETLPPADVIFNAIGETQAARPAIAAAAELIGACSLPAINDPRSLRNTARPRLADALRGVPGCAVVRTLRRERHSIGSVEFASLVRPVDAHGGRGLERVDDAAALQRYVQRHPQHSQFDLTPYVEYRSADGWYRKYRVVLVDGRPYPYHLAISRRWMVHYVGSETPAHGWARAEEERFLARPQSVFADWEQTFCAVAGALGLDYVGIDCALLPDGRVLIFEADAAMLVHARESQPELTYKIRYVPAIFTALETMLERRIGG